jgi:N-acetylglucosamine-6-phosphate deacetylase
MNPELSGAHNRKYILEPSRELVDALIDTGAVRLINIAPETSPAAVDIIRHAASRGVIVGAGHAKPHAERLREAVEAGLRYIIHLGNGPTGSSLKAFRDGGMLEESLRNDALTVTIILDGVHIHPALVRDWIERKGMERVIAVSDAGFAMGNPGGEFEVLGVRGRVASGGWLEVMGSAPRNPLSSDFGALFGSAADMRRVFETALNMLTRAMPGVYHRHHPALPLEEALVAAARLTATTPASLLGLDDRGRIEPGLRADLALLEIEGVPGAHRVEVASVWVGG